MLEAVNADGRTPLAVAVALRHVKLAKFLRLEGASDRNRLVETLAHMSGYDTGGGYTSSSVGFTSGGATTDDVDGGGGSDSAWSESDASESEARGGGGYRGKTPPVAFPLRSVGRTRGDWEGHGTPVLFDNTPSKRAGGYSYYRDSLATTEGGRPDTARSDFSEGEGTGPVGSRRSSLSNHSDAGAFGSVTSSAYGDESSAYDTDGGGASSRGGWSDITPVGSAAGSESGGSLWNSDVESSAVGDSDSEYSWASGSDAGEPAGGAANHYDDSRGRVPSFLR